MLAPSYALCREGVVTIGFTGFSALLFSILDCWPLAIIFWLLCLFSLNFFRDPERVIPQGEGIAVSPADGTVIRIEERPELFSGERKICVSIFMSVFNVHVNRSPVAGQVKEIRYFPGKFFNASFDKASEDNERCALLIDSREGGWTMVQIAGLIARRIVCRAEEGDEVKRGERVGMIRFGSRVDLYLPPDYSPAVEKGAKVLAGQTVIARKK